MFVAGGRFPTQRAWPDCLGFRGGPRGADAWVAGRPGFPVLAIQASSVLKPPARMPQSCTGQNSLRRDVRGRWGWYGGFRSSAYQQKSQKRWEERPRVPLAPFQAHPELVPELRSQGQCAAVLPNSLSMAGSNCAVKSTDGALTTGLGASVHNHPAVNSRDTSADAAGCARQSLQADTVPHPPRRTEQTAVAYAVRTPERSELLKGSDRSVGMARGKGKGTAPGSSQDDPSD